MICIKFRHVERRCFQYFPFDINGFAHFAVVCVRFSTKGIQHSGSAEEEECGKHIRKRHCNGCSRAMYAIGGGQFEFIGKMFFGRKRGKSGSGQENIALDLIPSGDDTEFCFPEKDFPGITQFRGVKKSGLIGKDQFRFFLNAEFIIALRDIEFICDRFCEAAEGKCFVQKCGQKIKNSIFNTGNRNCHTMRLLYRLRFRNC